MAVDRAGKRFAPRVFEYRLTNSQTSRAYLLTACSSKCLMNIGAKHSLCLISMLSKMQPSESIPIKNSLVGLKSRKIWAASLIRFRRKVGGLTHGESNTFSGTKSGAGTPGRTREGVTSGEPQAGSPAGLKSSWAWPDKSRIATIRAVLL